MRLAVTRGSKSVEAVEKARPINHVLSDSCKPLLTASDKLLGNWLLNILSVECQHIVDKNMCHQLVDKIVL
jgi:hypothetical protein